MQEPNSPNNKEQQFLSPAAKNYLSNYLSQVKEVLLKPKDFFASMPTDGNVMEPIIFCSISVGFAAIMTLLTSFNVMIGLFVFGAGTVGVFIISLLAYYLCKAMKGEGSLEATYRVFAYSSAAQLLSWVPVIGGIVGIYVNVVNYFGIKQVHNLSAGKAIAVIIISGVLSVGVFCTVGVAFFLKQLFHF